MLKPAWIEKQLCESDKKNSIVDRGVDIILFNMN